MVQILSFIVWKYAVKDLNGLLQIGRNAYQIVLAHHPTIVVMAFVVLLRIVNALRVSLRTYKELVYIPAPQHVKMDVVYWMVLVYVNPVIFQILRPGSFVCLTVIIYHVVSIRHVQRLGNVLVPKVINGQMVLVVNPYVCHTVATAVVWHQTIVNVLLDF